MVYELGIDLSWSGDPSPGNRSTPRDLQPTYTLPQVDTIGAPIAVFGNGQTHLYYVSSGNLIHASRSGSWLNASIIMPNIAAVFPAPAPAFTQPPPPAPMSQKKSSPSLSTSDTIALVTSVTFGVLTVIISIVAIYLQSSGEEEGKSCSVDEDYELAGWSQSGTRQNDPVE